MDIKALVILLLIGRAIAVLFMLYVLVQQIRLVRIPPPPELVGRKRKLFLIFRFVALGLGVIILAGNFIPVLIDIGTLLHQVEGRRSPSPLLAAYGLSNSFSDAASAIAMASLYYIAKKLNIP